MMNNQTAKIECTIQNYNGMFDKRTCNASNGLCWIKIAIDP